VQAAATRIPHGTLEIVADNEWVAPGHEFSIGLHFQLEKGWHIYWINPGDSGEPPRVTWQLPTGLTAEAMAWPAPRRLGTASIVDFGYEDSVMLIAPMHAAVNLPARGSAQVGAEVRLLVCREMCIPGNVRLSLTLPIKSQPPAPDAQSHDLFAVARKSLPRPAPRNWRITVNEVNGSFVLTANLGRQIKQALFFPLAESQIDNATTQKLQLKTIGFRLELRKSDRLLKPIERLKGVLVLDADRAYLIDLPVSKSGAARIGHDIGIHAAKSSQEDPQR